MDSGTKAVPAGLAGGVVSALLFLAYAGIPLFGIPAGVLSPFPIAYAALRWGRLSGLLAAIAGGITVLLLDGVPSLLIFLVQAAVLSLLLAEGLRRKLGGTRSLAISVVGTLGIALLFALLWYGAQGISLAEEIGKGIDASTAHALKLYEGADLPPEVRGHLKEGAEAAGRLLREIYPSLVVVGLLIMSGASLLLLRRSLPLQTSQAGVGAFAAFRVPELLVWPLIIAGFARLAPPPWGGMWALNVLVILGTLYFLQGMAVLQMLIDRSPMAGMLRVILYMLLIVQSYLALAVAVLGLFDLWGNFRTPRQQQNL